MTAGIGMPPSPARRVLYGRRPLGEGTPLVESLTGFLARLCAARHLRVLDVLDHLIRPLVPVGTLPARTALHWFLSQNMVRFDGMHSQSALFVSAMEQLTGLSRLDLHTFLPWARLFAADNSGAVRSYRKRWCARCLEQWHLKGAEPWEPLLWRSPVSTYCPLHRIPLSEGCPSCGAVLPVVSDRVPLGFCDRCGHLLHQGDACLRGGYQVDFQPDESARFEWWISFALGQMLSAQRFALDQMEPGGFARLIDSCCSSPGPGLSSVARYLDTSLTTVLRWRRPEAQPRLRRYLSVCLRLGANPAEVALGDQYFFPTPWNAHTPAWRSPSVSGTPRVQALEVRWRRLRCALDRAIAQGTFRTVGDFAREQRVHVSTIQRRFPDRYSALVAKAAALRAAERVAFAARCEKALESVVLSSEVRSPRSVARSFGITGRTLRRYCPDLYARVVALNEERSGEARRTRDESRRQVVREAVRDLLDQGVRPSFWLSVSHAGLPKDLCRDPSLRKVWSEELRERPSTRARCRRSGSALREPRRGPIR